MPICPAGHQTSQTDFCDTCGLQVAADQSNAPAPAPVVPSTTTFACPNCGTANVADALFCEACGFDFTTGAMPAPETGAPAGINDPNVESAPRHVATEADPVEVFDGESPAAAPPVEGSGPTSSPTAPSQPIAPAPPIPAPKSGPEWVAEMWIDPDWYAAQGSTDPLPSPGLPDIVPLSVTGSNLIGRVSHSRGIFPAVDCELDTGCSRRHALLTTDGSRWWIEDLDSANGTFVGPAAGPLPAMPIPRGRVELTLGQRIYVGAWTRIVVRRATEDEAEALAH